MRKLPDHWETKPLKALALYMVSNVDKVPSDDEQPVRLCNYTDVYKNEFISPDMELMRTTATTSEIEKFHLLINDVVITKDSESWEDIAIPSLVVDTADDILCGYHLAILRPKTKELNGRFLFRCLQSKSIRLQLELSSTGVTRFGLPKGEIGRMLLPVAPMGEQQSIADYLDSETFQIDVLIKEKMSMLSLLTEKRVALINRAVMRGLEPDVPLKSTEHPWLGDIPAHWEIRRLKWLITDLTQGWSPLSNSSPVEEDEFGILKLSAIKKGCFLADQNKSISAGKNIPLNLTLCKGDVLISRSNTPELVGDVCTVPQNFYNLLIPDLIYRLRVNAQKIMSEFLTAFLLTKKGRLQITRDARGSSGSMVKVSQDHVTNWLIPNPPLPEQIAIVANLNKERKQTAEMEATLKKSIELLKERRSALITAAITGQLEIPEISSEKEGQYAH